MRRHASILVIGGLVVALGTGVAVVGSQTEPRRVAGGFLAAVQRGDCQAAAAFTSIPVARGCSPEALGLPRRLDGVGLGWDTSGWSGFSDQAAVLLYVPDSRHAWNLHVQRVGDRWLVDAVEVSGDGHAVG